MKLVANVHGQLMSLKQCSGGNEQAVGKANHPTVSSHCRRRFTNVCLDNICGYLVELQSLSPNSALQQTIGNFKSLQAKLEKLH